MAEVLLKIEELTKSFGGLVAIQQLSMEVEAGEIHAVIGPNGAGKTTLIAQLSGSLKPDSGRILFENRDITHVPEYRRSALGLARSFQITSVLKNFSALDNVALAVQAHAGHSFRFWSKARKAQELREPALEILEKIGLTDRMDMPASSLSHGEQRQLELAMALATRPKLLLLDEPMAGMGVEESQKMVELLQDLKGTHTLVLIEHDMDAVFALADRITVLVYGESIACDKSQKSESKANHGKSGLRTAAPGFWSKGQGCFVGRGNSR
ncbi:MAG: ABC transporter ATP-binding protein [Deltaproteobacteria bacterium]